MSNSRVKTKYRENYYIDGNTVRKVAVPQQEIEALETRTNPERIQAKNAPINLGYVVAMLVAAVLMCLALIWYVNIQSDLRNRVNNIASMEKELNNLKLANDETYTKILSDVDLEEIKYIAITELGMTYAKEGQVVTYSSNEDDYCIQYSDIGE